MITGRNLLQSLPEPNIYHSRAHRHRPRYCRRDGFTLCPAWWRCAGTAPAILALAIGLLGLAWVLRDMCLTAGSFFRR